MKLALLIERFRYWGLKGAVAHVRTKACERMRTVAFWVNALAHPMRPRSGVTIVGRLSSRHSLSKVLRDLVLALRETGVPYQTYDLDDAPEIPGQETDSLLTPRRDFRALRYAHVIEVFDGMFPALPGVMRHRIAFWEFETGLVEAYQQLRSARALLAMSDFNRDVFRSSVSKGVRIDKILYPFRHLDGDGIPSAAEIRRRFGIAPEAFVVFFNFDFGSSFGRKNPDGALRAFAEAFRETPDACLVFKTMQAKKHPEKLDALKRLAEDLSVKDRVVFVNDYLPTQDLYGLTAACDCYLSLHRGEGFGLGIAEAMSLGKPVVITDYSAPKEFCNADNGVLVPYRLVDVPRAMCDHPNYRYVKQWAEPDIHAAAAALGTLYADRALCRKLGTRAAQSIRERFSPEHFASDLRAFLQTKSCKIEGCPPAHLTDGEDWSPRKMVGER